MALIKKPYEISVWQDIIMYVGTPVSGKTSPTKNINDLSSVDYQYYDEQRLATIGSHTMTTPMRVINPTLTRNINGVETLKFEMYYQYIDPNTGERKHNPLIDYLVNERKIKLYYEDDDPNHPDHWYDFIIKKDEEKARDNKYSFTCNSLAASELGKTGFKIELNTELENNTGTVQELAEKILENSDWRLSETQDIIKQTINEPLYEIKLNRDIPANYTQTPTETYTIPSGAVIYVYYTPYANKETDYFQFIYIANESKVEVLSDRMTLVCDDVNVLDLYLENVNWIDDKPDFQDTQTATKVANYRGDRYVRKQLTAYDPVLKKTVQIYKDNFNNRVYGYKTTKYYGVDAIINYIHNSTNFGGTSYWYGFGNGTSIEKNTYPSASAGTDVERKNYLSVKIGAPIPVDPQDPTSPIDYINSPRIFNDGIIYNYSKINTFTKNDTYLLRMKVRKMRTNGTLGNYLVSSSNFPFTCQVRKYSKIDKTTGTLCFNFKGSNVTPEYDLAENLTEAEFNSNRANYYIYSNGKFWQCGVNSSFNSARDYYIRNGYALIEAKCSTPASIEELKNNIGIFFFRSAVYGNKRENEDIYDDLGEKESYYIEDVQLTQGIKENGRWLRIDDIPVVKFATINHFYYPSENIGFTNPDDYLYISEDPDDEEHPVIFTPIYNDNDNKKFEKIRSITAKESNRFNLLQELCETFECWIKFYISHNENGTISIINNTFYSPVTLTEEEFNLHPYYLYDFDTKNYIRATEYDSRKQYFEEIERKCQDKSVIFYGEILEDNPLGFKYGINLKDVTRTLDSDQIVTKIIVKNNSNEYADNGFCSIARAVDNTIKENFIYNFDYYVKQGILNETTLNNDLYTKDLNGSIGLYPKLAEYNAQRDEIISRYVEEANDITKIQGEIETNTLIYNSASEELSKLIDPVSGKLFKYTGYTYEDFGDQVSRAYKEDNVYHIIPAYAGQIYYVSQNINNLTITAYKANNSVTNVKYYTEITIPEAIKGSDIKTKNPYRSDVSDDHFDAWNALKYYLKQTNNTYLRCQYGDKIKNDEYYLYLGETNRTPYYIQGRDVKFTSSERLLNVGKYTYYWRSDQKENNSTYFQTSDSTSKLKLEKNNSVSVYIYGAYYRIGNASPDDTINDTTTISYIEQINTLQRDKVNAEAELIRLNLMLEQTQAQYDEDTTKLKDIAKATEEIEKQFITKYARYIQEGSWNDDNYMDDDLYYLDAVQVLYQSAYPKVSYNVSVLELSALEGYEPYKFQLAHKTFIEDTEFFGWANKESNIPAREYIVVTELSNNLDEPDKNTIKVQNYKNHFEDLFQRITAATQNLEYHSGDYSRAADAISPNGIIEQTVIDKTMAAGNYIITNATNQSIVIDTDGLKVTKTTDPAQVVRLTSGGLLVSKDGQDNWGVAISGYGINTEYLSAGAIDAEKINIVSGSRPTFKWDANGLRALSFTVDDNQMTSYNPSQYVTFDHFGIYGINGITNFVPNTVSEVEKNASFALTWNGLYMRSNYRNGYVSISPNEDIALYGYGNQEFNKITDDAEELDEIYFLDNRSAFYYKNLDNEYIQCTTESLNELYGKEIFVNGYALIQPIPNSLTSDNYYLSGGQFIQCIGGEPTDLTNNKIYEVSSGTSGQTAIRRGKFGMLGRLNDGTELYGLALYDQDGKITLTTQSNGTLWLQDSMRIGTPDQSNTIYIGVGEVDSESNVNRYKVIKVNNLADDEEKFVVYSDGTLKAIDAEISGIITAEGGVFNGTVYADSGIIGGAIIENGYLTIPEAKIAGFTISEHSITTNGLELYSAYEEDIYEEQIGLTEEQFNENKSEYFYYNEEKEQYIQCDENSIYNSEIPYYTKSILLHPSLINANNINIGDGANITNKLQIGNLKLINPNRIDYNFVEDLTEEEFNQNKTNYYIQENDRFVQCTEESIFDSAVNYFIRDEIDDNPVLTLREDYLQLLNNGNIIGKNWSIETNNNITTAKFDLIDVKSGIFRGHIEANSGEFHGLIKASTIEATTISVTNFITEKIRSMGGAFIFKPSYEIKEIEISNENGIDYVYVTLNSENDYNAFTVNDIVGFTDETIAGVAIGKVEDTEFYEEQNELTEEQFNENKSKYYYYNEEKEQYIQCDENSIYNSEITYYINNYIIKISGISNIDDFNPQTITLFGNVNSDVIIGINSDEVSNSFLPQKSLVIEDFSYSNGNISPSIKLLLGDLTSLNKNEVKGYGLYADNVYLHGSLITETNNSSSYAGVNTINDFSFSFNKWNNPTVENPESDTQYTQDKIVFWGGAAALTQDKITRSPFIVTDKGNIFARDGIFKGTVIADSTIANSIIKTPIIEGTGESPSLKIYDTGTTGGIGFYQKNGDIDGINNNADLLDTLILSITSAGFEYKENKNFIKFNDNNIIFNSDKINIEDTEITNGLIKNKQSIKIQSNDAFSEIDNNNIITNEAQIIRLKGLTSDVSYINYQNKNGYYCLFVE